MYWLNSIGCGNWMLEHAASLNEQQLASLSAAMISSAKTSHCCRTFAAWREKYDFTCCGGKNSLILKRRFPSGSRAFLICDETTFGSIFLPVSCPMLNFACKYCFYFSLKRYNFLFAFRAQPSDTVGLAEDVAVTVGFRVGMMSVPSSKYCL